MTDYVLDSSVIVKWFLEEDYSDRARQLFDLKLAGQAEFWAPELLVAEFGNVMWKRHQQGILDAAQVQESIEDMKRLELHLVSALDLILDAVNLALAHHRTVYDALYLALSLQRGCLFVTADEKLYNAVNREMPQIRLLSGWVPGSPSTSLG